jgi:hypothetical protein
MRPVFDGPKYVGAIFKTFRGYDAHGIDGSVVGTFTNAEVAVFAASRRPGPHRGSGHLKPFGVKRPFDWILCAGVISTTRKL